MQITDRDGLAKALAAPRFLLFKHSHRCSISTRARAEYDAFLAAQPDVATGWIDVVADRELSLATADETGVEHASPQALLLREGRVDWHASHFDITRAALEEAVAAAP